MTLCLNVWLVEKKKKTYTHNIVIYDKALITNITGGVGRE